jgi:hypothetical protein
MVTLKIEYESRDGAVAHMLSCVHEKAGRETAECKIDGCHRVAGELSWDEGSVATALRSEALSAEFLLGVMAESPEEVAHDFLHL